MSLRRTQQTVNDHMLDIASIFNPGVKVTVLVRTPSHPNRDFMMTDDEIPELRAMLDRCAVIEMRARSKSGPVSKIPYDKVRCASCDQLVDDCGCKP